MGFRYRKSVKLLPGVRLNLSKSGISTSFGGRGATVNVSKRGVRTTLSIPGTGLSYSTMSKSAKKTPKRAQTAAKRAPRKPPVKAIAKPPPIYTRVYEEPVLAWQRANEARFARDLFSRKRRGRGSYIFASLSIFAIVAVAFAAVSGEGTPPQTPSELAALAMLLICLAWAAAQISLLTQRIRDMGWPPFIGAIVILGSGFVFWPMLLVGIGLTLFWPPKRINPRPLLPPEPEPSQELVTGPLPPLVPDTYALKSAKTPRQGEPS
ncbi:MAG: DUF4236 domain-containing protein [Sphingomonadales bacterium]|nr:MAG: DUF4236 domain-containing protein [Sphingomonadales bacterium]